MHASSLFFELCEHLVLQAPVSQYGHEDLLCGPGTQSAKPGRLKSGQQLTLPQGPQALSNTSGNSYLPGSVTQRAGSE